MVADGSIWPHVLASANIAALGFGLSILVGVPMGLAMGRSVAIRSALEPFTTALNASPHRALRVSGRLTKGHFGITRGLSFSNKRRLEAGTKPFRVRAT